MKPEMLEYISLVNDPQSVATRFLFDFASTAEPGAFVLCVGSTHTSDIEGISAAGASGPLRRLTPAVDAEALVTGRCVTSDRLPASPTGIVSPVVISRACLSMLGWQPMVVDCGCFSPPAVASLKVGGVPARCLSTGNAMDRKLVDHLYAEGIKVGEKISRDYKRIIIGECVPGGTITALGVLVGLGVQAHGLTSSSLPDTDHDSRLQLVNAGLQSIAGRPMKDALDVVACLGDPMQPFAAGLARGASARAKVMLGGGSQMLSVYALASAASQAEPLNFNVAVATTKWVAFDGSAATGRLAALLNAPFVAARPNFHLSKHQGMRAYEDGNVKEGTGAGACMVTAFLHGYKPEEIIKSIDRTYDEMVPTPHLVMPPTSGIAS